MTTVTIERETLEQWRESVYRALLLNGSLLKDVFASMDAALAQSQAAQPEQKGYEHRWNREGDRCVKCRDKDWMGGPCSVSDAEYMERQEEEIARLWEDVRQCNEGIAETSIKYVALLEKCETLQAAHPPRELVQQLVDALEFSANEFGHGTEVDPHWTPEDHAIQAAIKAGRAWLGGGYDVH